MASAISFTLAALLYLVVVNSLAIPLIFTTTVLNPYYKYQITFSVPYNIACFV